MTLEFVEEAAKPAAGPTNTEALEKAAAELEADTKSETDTGVDPDTETEGDSETGEEGASLEEVAKELGWNPDYEGEGKVDAKTYLLRSREIQDTMRDHIKEQKSQLSELNNSVAELKAHNEKVYKAEVKKLKSEVESLKKERKEAIEDGDVDKVEELDGQIDELKESMAVPGKKDDGEQEPSSNPEFDAWVAENQWYNNDAEMAAFADSIATDYPGAPFKRVAALVDRKVREVFPDKFSEGGPTPAAPQKSKTPSPVEKGGAKPQTSKFTKADLTETQKSVMQQFVRQGIMTEKQYIEDIAKTEGVA